METSFGKLDLILIISDCLMESRISSSFFSPIVFPCDNWYMVLIVNIYACMYSEEENIPSQRALFPSN